jgi:asparagine synthase (glutamine-hydrolysing)
MCGILGVAVPHGRPLTLDDAQVARMRDAMLHRGPDGAGLVRRDNVVLAHRRLAVRDPSDAAAQPMLSADARYAIVYNGELYNDAELRAELKREGKSFVSTSDTETILVALSAWGRAALDRFRGMYALAFHDARERTMLLARDPLGIKPLHYALRRSASGHDELVFASEAQAILAHPEVSPRPDLATVSAYLTTIRLTLGSRTLFDGIRTLLPGESLLFDLDGESIIPPRPVQARLAGAPPSGDETHGVRSLLADSVHRHLRADVPLCALLSGGLDSSIICSLIMRERPDLQTYCSGAAGSDAGTDFHYAREVAKHLGARHAEAPVSREMFAQRWPELVTRLGLPLGTANEVAINEVARLLRADGMVVALSGEGADELFGGYDLAIAQAADFENAARAQGEAPSDVERGLFQLQMAAWIPPESKPGIMHEHVWRALEHDEPLRAFYQDEFAAIATERRDVEPISAHLRFQRRINLAGLLARLDTSTMLAGVEGRTPFADVLVACCAEQLPLVEKYTPAPSPASRPGSKLALRRAFADDLPRAVIERPKASFPLPFEPWLADHASEVTRSPLLRELFTEPTLHAIAANAPALWRVAWPVVNLALWSRRWWG